MKRHEGAPAGQLLDAIIEGVGPPASVEPRQTTERVTPMAEITDPIPSSTRDERLSYTTPATLAPDAHPMMQRRSAGAVLVAGAMIFFLTEFIAAAAWTDPPYSYTYHYISDLGVRGPLVALGQLMNSPLAWVMNTGFFLFGKWLARRRAARLLLTFPRQAPPPPPAHGAARCRQTAAVSARR